jgi:DNA-binding LacI/PurR family transcriptional regulator
MLISELSNPVDKEPTQFLSKSLNSKGYELLITLYHGDAKKFNHLLSQLSRHVADGAFIIPSLEYSAPAYLPLLNNDFPLVFIDRQPTFENCTTVTTSNKEATKNIMRECLNAGADHFILLLQSDNSVARKRLEGAVEFINENHLNFTQANSEYAPPAEFLSGNIAIISSSGLEAEKYSRTFLSKQRPPLLISGSFDDSPANITDFDHAFVVLQDFESMAETAADLMLEKMKGEKNLQTIEIPVRELVRIK